MESFLLLHESILHRGLLLLAFVIFALWETFRPRRTLSGSTGRRWAHHAILSVAGSFSIIWIYRVSGLVVASSVAGSEYGLLNREILPFGVRFVLSVLLLDLFRYGQHYMYHALSVLWRIHRVHHSDSDYDWSTGLRFHPGEVLLTQGSYLAVIALVAPPVLAVLLLELTDVVVSIFVHANVVLPLWLDSRLRWFLITPDMHRIHHSAEITEQNSNFGVVFPWWDRLFGTYLQEPAAGHDKMGIGLREFPDNLGLVGMLAQPFRELRIAPSVSAGTVSPTAPSPR